MDQLSDTEKRLIRDCLLVSYAQLLGPTPAILTDLVRRGFVEWQWNGGIPIYFVTDAGRKAVTS